MTPRDEKFRHLERTPDVDVLVIGAGINGISTWRDLSLQGLRVVLVEREDYCSGASAALSRMVHGGLRYLENGEFDLVRESLEERDRLLDNAPHYVAPLPTMVPVFSYLSGLVNSPFNFMGFKTNPRPRGAFVIKIGLSFYDWFTRKRRRMPRHRFHSRAETFRKWPRLNKRVVRSATYYDAWVSYPERLGVEMILDAEEACQGCFALNYVKVSRLGCDTFQIADKIGGGEVSIRPKVVINATGAWIDFTNDALVRGEVSQARRMIGGTKGSHLVVDHPGLLSELAGRMIYYENGEGRTCILFPFHGKVLIGSTDIRVDDPEVRCTDSEKEYILQSLRIVFPDLTISDSQIVYRFAGVRPLPAGEVATPSKISRSHECRIMPLGESAPDAFCLIGGKWTTFRAFGEDVADAALGALGRMRQQSTAGIAIGGGRGYPKSPVGLQTLQHDVMRRAGITAVEASRLVHRYGTRALSAAEFMAGFSKNHDGPDGYLRQEIIWLVRNEHVEHVADLILRRTNLAISGMLSLSILDHILDLLASERNWSKQQVSDERASTLNVLEQKHGVTESMLRARDNAKYAESTAATVRA